MKIIVKNNSSERQSPEVTIDTSTCHYPYAIREALWLALELDGYDKETIKNVFNLQEDVKTEPQAEPAQEQKQGHFTNNYAGAFDFLLCNGVSANVMGEGKEHAVENVIQKANELWQQQNQTT